MSRETSERITFKISSAVILKDRPFAEPIDSKILLVQENRDGKLLWNPPGGGAKGHESPMDTATRETFEEIGVLPTIIGLVGIYPSDRGDSESGLGFVFWGTIPIDVEFVTRKSEGIVEARFFSYKAVQNLISTQQIYKPDVYDYRALSDFYFKKRIITGTLNIPIDSIR